MPTVREDAERVLRPSYKLDSPTGYFVEVRTEDWSAARRLAEFVRSRPEIETRGSPPADVTFGALTVAESMLIPADELEAVDALRAHLPALLRLAERLTK